MATKLMLFFLFCCIIGIELIHGDPGRDLCKIIKNSGLKCSKISSYFFPDETFLSFNDDLARFTTEMKYLEVSNSNISILQARSFQRTPYLSHLILSDINLLEIEPGAFEGLKKLKLVDMSYNLLQSVPVDAFKYSKISRLNLEGNALLEVPSNDPVFIAKFLTSLSLKNCNIQYLAGSAFQQTPALVHLDLSYNYLKALPNEIFANLQHLTFLDLSGNRFQSLDIKVFESMPSFPKLPSTVVLYDNPWNCDCKLAKLSKWVTENIKTGTWSETPSLCRLKKFTECQRPKKVSWNAVQFKELMTTC